MPALYHCSMASDNFATPLQERVHRRLKLIGDGPAALFRDACRLVGNPGEFTTATHLIGHLLREVVGLGRLQRREYRHEVEREKAGLCVLDITVAPL